MNYSIPLVLMALAVAVLAVGLAFSSRFRRRWRYISGIILVALSLAMFWPVQVLFSEWMKPYGGVYGVVAALPLIASFFVFSSGIGLISKSNNTPQDDYYDNLL